MRVARARRAYFPAAFGTNGAIERLGLLALPLPGPCEPRRFGLIWSRGSPRLALVRAFRDIAVVEYANAGT